jgi:hypothetical protein
MASPPLQNPLSGPCVPVVFCPASDWRCGLATVPRSHTDCEIGAYGIKNYRRRQAPSANKVLALKKCAAERRAGDRSQRVANAAAICLSQQKNRPFDAPLVLRVGGREQRNSNAFSRPSLALYQANPLRSSARVTSALHFSQSRRIDIAMTCKRSRHPLRVEWALQHSLRPMSAGQGFVPNPGAVPAFRRYARAP